MAVASEQTEQSMLPFHSIKRLNAHHGTVSGRASLSRRLARIIQMYEALREFVTGESGEVSSASFDGEQRVHQNPCCC